MMLINVATSEANVNYSVWTATETAAPLGAECL